MAENEVVEEFDIDLEGPITIDLSQVDDSPVPEGWYPVKVENVTPKRSSQKQIPQLFFLTRITGEGEYANRTLIWSCGLAGQGLMFTKRCFAALGMPEQLEYATVEELCEDLIGRECEAKVKHREYDGETQAQVNAWRELDLDLTLD